VRSHPEQITEHGDRVLVIARTSAKGETSGVATDARVAHVWTIRGGKITRLQTFRTRDEALEAVGLRE
jgi:ketosteroid isomerase-like protein